MFPVPLLAYPDSPFLPVSPVHFPTRRKGPVIRAGRREALRLGRNATSDPGRTADSAKSSKTFSCHSRLHRELFLCSMKCQRPQKQSGRPRSACTHSHNLPALVSGPREMIQRTPPARGEDAETTRELSISEDKGSVAYGSGPGGSRLICQTLGEEKGHLLNREDRAILEITRSNHMQTHCLEVEEKHEKNRNYLSL